MQPWSWSLSMWSKQGLHDRRKAFPVTSPLFLVSSSPHVFNLSFSLRTGSWSIQRMSCVTSSPTRCRRRSASGWPPPSQGRRCCRCAVARTSRASGASCTLCRPASLWRGRGWFLSFWCWIKILSCDSTSFVLQDVQTSFQCYGPQLSTQRHHRAKGS